MRKRLLLIVALGISFSPAVFAATETSSDLDRAPAREKPAIGDHKVEEKKAGEMKVSQHAGPDIVCPYAERDRKSRLDLNPEDKRTAPDADGHFAAGSAAG